MPTDKELLKRYADQLHGPDPARDRLLDSLPADAGWGVLHRIKTAELAPDIAVAKVVAARPCATTWRRRGPKDGPHWLTRARVAAA